MRLRNTQCKKERKTRNFMILVQGIETSGSVVYRSGANNNEIILIMFIYIYFLYIMV